MTGEELRKLRKSLGLTVERAADQIAVSDRTFRRYETAERVPETSAKLFELDNGLRPPSRRAF